MATNQEIIKVFENQKKRSLLLRTEKIADRKKRIKPLINFILSNSDRISDAIYQDFKKPKVESALSELYPVLTEIRHTLKNMDEWARTLKVDTPASYLGSRAEVRYEPKGVCLIIAPWNYPFSLCFGPLISCLAAGNTAIVKPSELTPHTSALIAKLVNEFFDEDTVAVVEGAKDVSGFLLTLPFDHIFFTGSPGVGKIVMKAASENLSSVTLELGGKSPAIIDDSATLADAAKRIAYGKFLNNGQTCIAPDYVLIEESVKEKFIEALKAEVKKMFGVDNEINESSTNYTRLVNRNHFDRLNAMWQDALEKGATVEMKGSINPDENFIHPIILTNVSPNATVMQDEIFGPILPILTYRSIDHVIETVNSKPKPLALYIFSHRKSVQEKIIAETSAGSVGINECVVQFAHPDLPFGGVNNSGIGKSHGRYGFISFSNEKSVLKQKRGFSLPYLTHPPYSDFRKKLANVMLKWF